MIKERILGKGKDPHKDREKKKGETEGKELPKEKGKRATVHPKGQEAEARVQTQDGDNQINIVTERMIENTTMNLKEKEEDNKTINRH